MLRTHQLVQRVVITVILLAACGGDGGSNGTGPGGSQTGTFQVTVTGGVSASFTGSAVFSSQPAFQLILSDLRGSHVAVLRTTSGRPAAGTHPLGDDPQAYLAGTIYAGTVQIPGATPFASPLAPGTLTLTSSSPERMQGTIQLNAKDEPSDRTATVIATFTAVCSTASGGPPCT